MKGRPYDFGSGKSMKVLVLMTDGQNTNTYALKPEFKEGNSPLVIAQNNNQYYYYPAKDSTTSDYYRRVNGNNEWKKLSEIGGSIKSTKTYADVWGEMSISTFESTWYNRATGSGLYRRRGGSHLLRRKG